METVRIVLCRLAVTLALAGTVLVNDVVHAAPAVPVPAADGDAHNLVLLAPGRPVFIQIRVQVDGQGLRAVRRAYAVKLFGQYDKNGDQGLDRKEAEAIPPLVKSSSARETVSIADRWEAVDLDPADERISLDELAAYIDRVFGSTFLLSVKPLRSTQNVDLFPLLDSNRDGRLSRAEMSAAPQVLRKLDLDDDETYTIDELQPFRNPQLPAGPAAPSAEQPFVLLGDGESIDRAVRQLQLRYGGEQSPARPPRLDRETLGLDGPAFAAHDADGDGLFDSAELAAFLRRPAPHLVIEAQLFESKAGKPKLQVIVDRIGAVGKKDPANASRLALAVGSIEVDLKTSTVRARNDASDNRNFYTTEFRRADGDKNKYLSEQEFARLPLLNAEFKAVDRNADGMIVLEELLAYIGQDLAASQSHVELSISHDGKSVFELLDRNYDNRLDRRELMHAFDRLREYDRDGDDAVTAVELAGRFSGTLEFGRPNLFRNAAPGSREGMTAPVVNAPTAGPDWFRKMDRNRDGDVSPREFLGPVAVFRKLDTDGDSLISACRKPKRERRRSGRQRGGDSGIAFGETHRGQSFLASFLPAFLVISSEPIPGNRHRPENLRNPTPEVSSGMSRDLPTTATQWPMLPRGNLGRQEGRKPGNGFWREPRPDRCAPDIFPLTRLAVR